MLTLSDINALTNSFDGSIYSDLYKDVYGTRPRNVTFDSIEEFDADYKYLAGKLEQELVRERELQNANAIRFEANAIRFEGRVRQVMELIDNCTREDAIRIIIQAEGLEEDVEYYGYEALEYELELKYGYIKSTL